MSWIKRNAETVTAIGTAITALVAVLALAGVKLQIDATQQLHDTQAGKEIYREFLSLSIKNPELARPGDCPNFTPDRAISYDFFVEHLLFTAEEAVLFDENLALSFENLLSNHGYAICGEAAWTGYTEDVNQMISRTQKRICPEYPTCSE